MRAVNLLWPVNRAREATTRVGRHSADTLRGQLGIKSELAAGTWGRSQVPSLYLSLSLALSLSLYLYRSLAFLRSRSQQRAIDTRSRAAVALGI